MNNNQGDKDVYKNIGYHLIFKMIINLPARYFI